MNRHHAGLVRGRFPKSSRRARRLPTCVRCRPTLPAHAARALLACLIGLAGPAVVWAADVSTSADATTALEPVTVTASRIVQSAADTLPSASVITREDIENSQATDVLSLLARQAGVEVAQSGGLGAQSSIFMRGFNSNQTLVLIDGIAVNAVEAGGATLEHVMLDQIDHIEIVRGNVSALYGSQAVGGVIQIFTRGAEGPAGVSLDAQAGQERTRNLALGASGNWGTPGAQTHAALNVSTNGMDGFSAINAQIAPAANPNNNPYQSSSLSAQLSQQIGATEVGVRLYGTRGRLSFDDPTNYSFVVPNYNGAIQTNTEHSELTTAAIYVRMQPLSAWTSTLQAGSSFDRSANTSSFPESFDIGTTVSRTNDFSWNNAVTLNAQNRITAGLEHVEQDGLSTSYTARFAREVQSGFVGYLGDLGPNQVQANLREDHYSDFGGATSALLGYGYRLTDRLKAIVELSNAFDAPTFDDLYYPGASNPHLKPEKSRSVETGFAFQEGASGARATVFRSLVHDLIAFDSANEIPENIGAARLEGLELEAHANLGGWQIHGNATLQRPVDAITEQVLLRRATHELNAGIARSFGPWRTSLDVRGAGQRFDSDINTFERIALPGYVVTDLVVRYQLSPSTILSAVLRNAFDQRYALVDGYNTPGRVFLVGVALRL